MNNVFVHHATGRRTTRLVRRLVMLGFVIGLITLLSFVWYLYQMHLAKGQMQSYQDQYTRVFSNFNITLSDAQRDLRQISLMPVSQVPSETAQWSDNLIAVSIEMAKIQHQDSDVQQQKLDKTILTLLDLRQCMVSTHIQLQELNLASDEQCKQILASTRRMRDIVSMHHGMHRLERARMIRQYLDHYQDKSQEEVRVLVDQMRDVIVLKGMDTEFGQLSRYIDQLHRTDDLAQIADLKDNKIAALLNRMRSEVSCAEHQQWKDEYFQELIVIEKHLFGKTIPSNAELQAIDYAHGSFLDHCYQRVSLDNERRENINNIQVCFNELLILQTQIALQTQRAANRIWVNFEAVGKKNFIQISVILSTCWGAFFLIGLLIHKQVRAQVELQQKTQEELHHHIEQRELAQQESQRLHQKLMQAHKLESVGQLAAGIAHEINSPSQFVSDNSQFLKGAFTSLMKINDLNCKLICEARHATQMMPYIQAIDSAIQELDAEFLWEEIPQAIDQTIEGIHKVSEIVGSMRQFAQPARTDKIAYDMNNAVTNALMVARNTWKYAAKIQTQLDENLPEIPAFPSDINQALFNIIVNAAQAVADLQKTQSLHEGLITITSQMGDDCVQILISDNGVGIDPAIRDRIFDPFFTTRPVGQGAGQGLALAYSSVVEKHQGKLEVQSELGRGSTFTISLPLVDDDVEDDDQLLTSSDDTATA